MPCPLEGDTFSLSVMIEMTEATLYSSQPCEVGEDSLAKENHGLWSGSADKAEGMSHCDRIEAAFGCGLVKASLRT